MDTRKLKEYKTDEELEQVAHLIARKMPDMDPFGYALYLAGESVETEEGFSWK